MTTNINEIIYEEKIENLNHSDFYNSIKVENGKELQMALDNDYISLIYLKKGEYKLGKEKLTVRKKGKHLINENGAIFTMGLNIMNNCKLTGITFKIKTKTSNLYISNGSKIYINNCKFIGSENSLADGIYIEENSSSIIDVTHSYFDNLERGIVINSGNIVETLENNSFKNLNIGISNFEKGAIVNNISKIKDNSFENIKKYSIDFSTGVNINKGNSITLVTNGYEFARTLSINNNFAYVKGTGLFEEIDSYVYRAENSNDLYSALTNCTGGNIILLKNGYYFGDFSIDKEISLIGEDSKNTFIIPKANYTVTSPQYGIRISSSNVFIKNITIDGNGNKSLLHDYNFRDGIRYQFLGGENNIFSNIKIINIIRRGISIWPEMQNTLIKNCVINNIREKQGIYFNGSGIIENCILQNVKTGIEIHDLVHGEQIYITNNHFQNNITGIIFNEFSDDIHFKNNTFKNIEIGIDKKEIF